jgi:site-specific DNA-adenine methylase
MKITGPLFKWFGSKWNASKHYPEPAYETLIEPFAGSAAYSLRYAEKKVQIFDADPNLQQLWYWLINEATEESIRQIPTDFPEGTDLRRVGLTYNQALLVKHWQRTNNVGDCWTTSPWGNKPGQWTVSTRSRVAEEVQAIKHWVFAPIYPQTGTWFIDPPYQYNYQYRKGLTVNYQILANAIQNIPRPNQLIVCEAICSKTGKVPDWLPFQFFRETVTSRRKEHQSHHSKELVWYKGPS